MRLTKEERAAAMAVAAMTVTVTAAGVKLIRRHTRYVMQKAAAFFDEQKENEAQADVPQETGTAVKAQADVTQKPEKAMEKQGESGADQTGKDTGAAGKEVPEMP